MKEFDSEFMVNNKNHKCNSKEIADNGEWYCDHLINARIKSVSANIFA